MNKPARLWLFSAVVLWALMRTALLSAEQPVNFTSEALAAEWVLNKMNPRSVKENREIGGYIYRTKNGTYALTKYFYGNHGNIVFPPPAEEVPKGAIVTASWHTHGASMPNIVSETFSPQDIKLNQKFSIDGYLGTPKGQFKHYQLNNPQIQILGEINN
ncbi:MAG: DUF4329 domain-containing protein [bacterium]